MKGTVKYSGYNKIGASTKKGMKNKRKKKIRIMRENEERKKNLLITRENEYYKSDYNEEYE